MLKQKKQRTILNTKAFMKEIKKRNELFNNEEHHDSHEFLIWFIN